MSDAARLPAAPADGRHYDVDSQRAVSSVRAPSLAVGVVVASGIALVLGLIRLGTPSLWFDEAFTADAVHRSPEWWVDNDQYHVLYDSVARAWTSLAGTSEWALRLPSVFGAMAACALLVVLARKVFDAWVALVSGILLATSPFLVKWSQQARGYTLLLAVSLVATLALLRALERGTRGSWALYGLAISATVVWHAVAGLLLVPAHLVLVAQRRQKLLPHGPLAAVIFVAVAVPWAATIAMRSTGAGVGMNWLTAPSPATVAHAVLDISGAAGFGLLLAVVGLVVLRLVGRTDDAIWLGVWAFAPFVLALLPSSVRPIFLDRFLIVAAPAFALLGGVAVRGIGRRLGVVAGLAAAVAACLGLVAWYQTADRGNWRGEDWRSAVAAVLARQDKAGEILVVPWSARPAAAYYGAPVAGTSTADSIWVLTWSETADDIRPEDRVSLGFGDHVRAEKLQFGRRVSAQFWTRRDPP